MNQQELQDLFNSVDLSKRMTQAGISKITIDVGDTSKNTYSVQVYRKKDKQSTIETFTPASPKKPVATSSAFRF